MKKLTPLILLLTLALGIKAQEVSFTVHAHQDDWQLFMGSKVVGDLNAGGKVVFITLTAGDAGNGIIGYGSPIAFYLARENGSVYSAKYAADLAGGVPLANPDSVRTTVNGHNLVKYVYKNTVNYFLRLPDGGGQGDGNALTGMQSLRKFKLGTIPAISSIDGQVTYNSWSDLTNTLKAIINLEKGTDSQVWINTPSLNTATNPDDHSDHTYSGVAAQDAVADLPWVGINEFVDYYSAGMPANLSTTDHAYSSAVLASCVWGLLEAKYTGTFDEGHKGWLPMDYFSVKRVPTGSSNQFVQQKNNNLTTAANALTEIPMVVSSNSPAVANNTMKFIISPFETGKLTTTVYDSFGNKVHEQNTNVEKKDALVITLDKTISVPGDYIVKNILNGKYIQNSKFVVQ